MSQASSNELNCPGRNWRMRILVVRILTQPYLSAFWIFNAKTSLDKEFNDKWYQYLLPSEWIITYKPIEAFIWISRIFQNISFREINYYIQSTYSEINPAKINSIVGIIDESNAHFFQVPNRPASGGENFFQNKWVNPRFTQGHVLQLITQITIIPTPKAKSW